MSEKGIDYSDPVRAEIKFREEQERQRQLRKAALRDVAKVFGVGDVEPTDGDIRQVQEVFTAARARRDRAAAQRAATAGQPVSGGSVAAGRF